jgi:GntR family transcriptional regulator, transcriptional repressor for pyruvate dehydrogenase complex
VENNIINNNKNEIQEKPETSRKIYESIIDSIKSDIIAGKLHTGEKLPPERELAKQFGVSRTSIREALRTLEILGVIESVQGSGNFIAGNFEKSLTESMSMMFLLQHIDNLQVSQLREALETKAALLAVDNITKEQIEHLEKIVKEMSITTDEDKNVALDRELHYTIAAASKNIIIMQILNILSEIISLYIKDRRREILSNSRNVPRLQIIHEEIINGIKNRDPHATYQAVRSHFAIIAENINK